MTLKNLEKAIAGQAIRPQECSTLDVQSTERVARCDDRDIIFQLRGRNRISK